MLRAKLTAMIVLCIGLSAFGQPMLKGELIFPEQEKHVHSSSIAECPNGDILACWFYGSGERGASDVVVQGSRLRKGADAWEPVFLMADTPDIPDCNPMLFMDPQDQLWLFWIAVPANSWEESILRYRITKDYTNDGPPNWAWQDIIILKPGDRFAEAMEAGYRACRPELPELEFGGYASDPIEGLVEACHDMRKRQKGWMTRTHPIVLPSGRILLPLYSDGYYNAIMAISDDQGEHWRASSPIPGIGLNQPSVVRKKDGTLVAYMRDEGPKPKRVPISTSSDDGETWEIAHSSDIPNPDSSLEVIALADGRWVMAYNDTEKGRHSLALAMSDDEGASWKWQRHLELSDPATRGRYHYPSLIQSKDGLIHVSYTHSSAETGLRSIKHVALNQEWIEQGD